MNLLSHRIARTHPASRTNALAHDVSARSCPKIFSHHTGTASRPCERAHALSSHSSAKISSRTTCTRTAWHRRAHACELLVHPIAKISSHTCRTRTASRPWTFYWPKTIFFYLSEAQNPIFQNIILKHTFYTPFIGLIRPEITVNIFSTIVLNYALKNRNWAFLSVGFLKWSELIKII